MIPLLYRLSYTANFEVPDYIAFLAGPVNGY